MSRYKQNSRRWRKGDLVLHYADEKSPKMLMKVIGYTRVDGLCKTQYVFKCHRRTIYKNDIAHLLDPEDFIKGSSRWEDYSQEYYQTIQDNFERVRIWNHLYQTGQRVITTSADGIGETVTKGLARFDKNGQAKIYLAETELHRFGWWSLEFVEAVN